MLQHSKQPIFQLHFINAPRRIPQSHPRERIPGGRCPAIHPTIHPVIHPTNQANQSAIHSSIHPSVHQLPEFAYQTNVEKSTDYLHIDNVPHPHPHDKPLDRFPSFFLSYSIFFLLFTPFNLCMKITQLFDVTSCKENRLMEVNS